MKTRQLIWVFVIAAVAVVFWRQQESPVRGGSAAPAASEARAAVEENHYSPGENLEQLDLARLESARRSLDIAMYAFTDRYVAEAVLRAARSGVRVRLYRDREQFDDEERRAAQRRSPSTTELLRGNPNIQVRVKSSRELMHLKAYCVDGVLLRDGSANWSASGLKRQDNNARYTTDAAQVRNFEQTFEAMWTRSHAEVR